MILLDTSRVWFFSLSGPGRLYYIVSRGNIPEPIYKKAREFPVCAEDGCEEK
jgi:hypothetical protein